MDKKISCPVCGQSDQVQKVSTVYLTGIGLRNSTARKIKSENILLSNNDLHALSQKMAPPSSGKQVPTRPIHPDIALAAFTAIVPFFIYGIQTTQPGMLLPVLGVLVCFYAVYAWQRRKLIARFEKEQAVQRAAKQHIQNGIDRWMKLHYCGRDEAVFEPGSRVVTPLDQMMGYLIQGK